MPDKHSLEVTYEEQLETQLDLQESEIKDLEHKCHHLQNLLNYCSQRAKKNTERDRGHFCQHRTNCEAIVNIVKDCKPSDCK